MDIFFVILVILCSAALIGVILVQNSKGGGLASNVGVSTQVLGGVKKSTDVIEKLTWGLMIALFLLSIASGFVFNRPTTPEDAAPRVSDVSDVIPPQAIPQNQPISLPVE